LIDAWQKVKYFLFIASLFVALLKKTSEFTHSDCQSAKIIKTGARLIIKHQR